MRDSTEAEVNALQDVCERLGGFCEHVSVEWLDGYMTALLASARVPVFEEWAPLAFDEAWPRVFADPVDHDQALHAVQRRWKVLAAQLDPQASEGQDGVLTLAPLMFRPDDAEVAAISATLGPEELEALTKLGLIWATGFTDAVADFKADWSHPPPDADAQQWFDECLGMIRGLIGGIDAELAARLRLQYQREPTREELVDEAAMGAQALRQYWNEHAPRPAPREVPPKVGRNEPCPCGSGKKYKKCHGAVTP